MGAEIMSFLLECNGKINPLGVNKDNVRLGFKIVDDCGDSLQVSKLQFQIASSEEKLKNNMAEIILEEDSKGWHSCRVPAHLLKDRCRYYWRVVDSGNIAYFETGISDWSADWICGWNDENENNQGKVQNFKRTFNIESSIEEARLYICGLGYFDAKVNGNQTDDLMFKPLVTDYKERCHPENPTLYPNLGHRITYYTYDVTNLLQRGENVLSVDVADGYFYNTEKVDYAYNFSFGSPRLIYELHIKVDGEWQVIKSDRKTLVCEKNCISKLYGGDVIDFTKADGEYRESLLVDDEIYMTQNGAEKYSNVDKLCDKCGDMSDGVIAQNDYIANKASEIEQNGCIDNKATKIEQNSHIANKVSENEQRDCSIDKGYNMVSSLCEEDKVCEILKPVTSRELDGGMLIDFGVNHTGGLEFSVEATEKSTIRISYAEVLDDDGRPNYETSIYDERSIDDGREDGSHQQSMYIVNAGKTKIKPLFSWKCYRYVLIQIEGGAEIKELKSLFIHMDIKRDGYFRCSNDTLNRINEMFVQTAYCNLHSGMLMDCPHREKRPYTGDGNKVMKSVFYNLNAIPFFYKWLDDMEDSQATGGKVTNTVPNFGGGGGYAWGNAICTLTKELYHYTGDIEVVKKGYNIILRWLDYYKSMEDENHTIRKNGAEWLLGDWLAPETVISNVHFVNTSCYYEAVESAEYLAGILKEHSKLENTAKYLAKTDCSVVLDCEKKSVENYKNACEKYHLSDTVVHNDECFEIYAKQERDWKELKNSIKENINRFFFDKEKMAYGHGVQGEDVLALALGIVPDEYVDTLKDKVENHYRVDTDYHLDTGIVITPILLDYLTKNGYEDIAYKIMTAKTYPSYYNLMDGETTFSEHWSKKWPDYYVGEIGNSKLIKGGGNLSHCHPMYGSVVAWLYEKVAGIDLSQLYEGVINFTPYLTENLKEAKANKQTPYGQVGIDWENNGESLKIKITLPYGLNGKCYFPSKYDKIKCVSTGEVYEAIDGYFDFEVAAGVIELESL